EGAGAWPADRDCVADLEGDLATQNVGDLVAVVMKMHRGTVPTGATSSNIMTLSSVSPFCSLRVDERPGAIFHTGPFPGITTKPFVSIAGSLCCLTLPLNLMLRCPNREGWHGIR